MGLDSDITTSQIEDVRSFHESEEVKKLDGTVQLTSKRGTLLIPVPSKDPRDPLNIPLWQKWVIVLTVCIFSTLGLTATSGLGGIIVFFIPGYTAAGKTYSDISALLTYPALFMGLGNIVSMPIALAIGRRPVFLASNVLLVVSCILCATNQSYSWHLAARCVLGLAAGQSEALCPLMVSEVHFLHERAKFLQFFSTIQTVLSGTLIILSSYIASTIGWRAWYYLFAGLSGGVAILSFFFVPETKYDRPLMAYEGATAIQKFEQSIDPKMETHISAMTIHDERILDTINHLPRTRFSDLKIFVTKSDWPEAGRCLKHMVQVFFFPNVTWVTVMNGVVLGINIALGLTYGNILTTYYHWEDKYVSVAQAGQLIVAFLALPMLGYGSDWIIKVMAHRNKGIHEPEHRLLTLFIPLLLGVLFVVIYGQAAQYPQRYQWMAIVFTLNAYYLSFIGANTAGITYLLDSYPTRSGPVLVVICAMRGVISFCLSYGTVQLYDEVGYANAFGLFGGLTAVFFVLGVLVYFTGKRIRHFCTRWTIVEVTDRPTMG